MSTYTHESVTDLGPVLVSELPAVRTAVKARTTVMARVHAGLAARRDRRNLEAAMLLGHASRSELLAVARRD